MELPTLDFSATLAKWRVVENNSKVCAYLDTAIDGDLVDAPVPQPPAPQRRQRKRSLTKVCEAARKAGANHVVVDGVVIAFSPAAAAAVPESTTNEWDTVLLESDHGPH